MAEIQKVADTEDVARILSREWVVEGVLINAAFTLRPQETYISVNRPAISTFDDDVATFVEAHPSFFLDEEQKLYRCAVLQVAGIRGIEVGNEETLLNIDVEVEPRDVFTKSHAGIFTRYEDKNLKQGDVMTAMDREYSADDILLEVRTQLMKLATISERTVSHP